MEKSERVLKALSDHSQSSDYKYERLYRYLFSEEMFAVAYQRIYAKQGNMTPGTDGKTIDEMSLERIERLIVSLKDESYQPHPARRVYIPKKNGKKRPLGIPSFEDKLVQEVVINPVVKDGTKFRFLRLLCRADRLFHHFLKARLPESGRLNNRAAQLL